MTSGDVQYQAPAEFGAWGRNGMIRQHGLSAVVLGPDIVLEPITSRGVVSTAASLRIPLADRDAVVELLKSLS